MGAVVAILNFNPTPFRQEVVLKGKVIRENIHRLRVVGPVYENVPAVLIKPFSRLFPKMLNQLFLCHARPEPLEIFLGVYGGTPNQKNENCEKNNDVFHSTLLFINQTIFFIKSQEVNHA